VWPRVCPNPANRPTDEDSASSLSGSIGDQMNDDFWTRRQRVMMRTTPSESTRHYPNFQMPIVPVQQRTFAIVKEFRASDGISRMTWNPTDVSPPFEAHDVSQREQMRPRMIVRPRSLPCRPMSKAILSGVSAPTSPLRP
jgi:hypothetical protein